MFSSFFRSSSILTSSKVLPIPFMTWPMYAARRIQFCFVSSLAGWVSMAFCCAVSARALSSRMSWNLTFCMSRLYLSAMAVSLFCASANVGWRRVPLLGFNVPWIFGSKYEQLPGLVLLRGACRRHLLVFSVLFEGPWNMRVAQRVRVCFT